MSTIKKPLKTSKMLTVEGTVYELGKTTINESQMMTIKNVKTTDTRRGT